MKKHEMEILEYTVQVKCISVFFTSQNIYADAYPTFAKLSRDLYALFLHSSCCTK